MAVKTCNKTVRDICYHIDKLMEANPKAAKTEVLQRLKAKMHCLLKQKRFRDVEELAYEILLNLESLRTENDGIKEAERK